MIYLLPFFGAILVGVSYAVLEESLKHISIATWYLVGGLASLIMAFFVLPTFLDSKVNVKPLFDVNILMLVIVAVITIRFADLTILLALKNMPATVVALAEVSYVIFVPIMAYLIFGKNQINPYTLIGGSIILMGLAVLLFGQMKMDQNSKLQSITSDEVKYDINH